MNQTLLTIAVITFVIYAIFNIIFLIDLRKTTTAMRDFLAKTDRNLEPALTELTHTLADIRKVASEVSNIAEKLRTVVGAAATVERTIQNLYEHYRDTLGQAAHTNIAGIKAGFKAGVGSLIKNLKNIKEDSQ